MSQVIHFRSRIGQRESPGLSLKEKIGRGSEITTIRPASPIDDTRDIAWKRTLGYDMYSKVRNTHMGISIVSIFHDIKMNEKQLYADTLDTLFRESADFLHGSYLRRKGDIGEIRDHLIFIILESIELIDYTFWDDLISQNDVVFIPLLMHEELSPRDHVFESRIIRESYLVALENRLEQIQMRVYSVGADIIVLDISQDPVEKLNHFFKHRYG